MEDGGTYKGDFLSFSHGRRLWLNNLQNIRREGFRLQPFSCARARRKLLTICFFIVRHRGVYGQLCLPCDLYLGWCCCQMLQVWSGWRFRVNGGVGFWFRIVFSGQIGGGKTISTSKERRYRLGILGFISLAAFFFSFFFFLDFCFMRVFSGTLYTFRLS